MFNDSQKTKVTPQARAQQRAFKPTEGEAERAKPFRPKVQERSILVQVRTARGRGSTRGGELKGLENERRG